MITDLNDVTAQQMTDVVSRDTLPVDLIDPDPQQPRQRFDQRALDELSASMHQNGLAVPILVRPAGDRYVIVHGERRWRAARSLAWLEIPAEIRALDESTVRWLQLAENLNRDDLSPVEEARAYRALLDVGETQKSLAERLGKDRTYITQKLRLLDLPTPLAVLLDQRSLSEGHVRQLLRIRGMYTEKHTIGGPPKDRGCWADVWAATTTVEAKRAIGFILLRDSRPEDWPAGYPFPPTVDAAFDAIRALCLDIEHAGPDYPRWVLPALYYAVLTVEAKVSVANLDRLIDGWIERIHAAVVYVRGIHQNAEPAGLNLANPGPGAAMTHLLWWGHKADLRHAGLLDDNTHITLAAAFEGALRDDAIALPSECHPGAPQRGRYEELSQLLAEASG